jgi:hypothetical protein
MSTMLYSTSRGTSLERQIFTLGPRVDALQKLTRYLREKVSATGSLSSMSTLRSGLSTLVWLRRVTEPLPMSPWDENFIPSLLASIVTAQKWQVSAWNSLRRSALQSYLIPTGP